MHDTKSLTPGTARSTPLDPRVSVMTSFSGRAGAALARLPAPGEGGGEMADDWRSRQAARSAAIDAEQWAEGTELEALLSAAATDQEAAQIVALARLLYPDDFRRREEGLEFVDQLRAGPRGNDPDFQKVIRVHERVARLTIKIAVRKARAALELVRSWS